MGLLGSDTYPCTVCGGEVDDKAENGRCPNCDAAFHGKCLQNIGNMKKENNIILSDTVKGKCPNCGNVAEW
jgi:predicted RNA-binding Zn-ribbon protein involved in translation (DUF1610 family)